jgi:hypothetical protein
VSGDHADVSGLDSEPLGRHVVRLAGGLQAFGQVRRERLLEEASQAGVLQLGLDHLGSRVAQRRHAETSVTHTGEALDHVRVGR